MHLQLKRSLHLWSSSSEVTGCQRVYKKNLSLKCQLRYRVQVVFFIRVYLSSGLLVNTVRGYFVKVTGALLSTLRRFHPPNMKMS